MNSPSVSRSPCKECGNDTLDSTLQSNEGFCASCAKKAASETNDVPAWRTLTYYVLPITITAVAATLMVKAGWATIWVVGGCIWVLLMSFPILPVVVEPLFRLFTRGKSAPDSKNREEV